MRSCPVYILICVANINITALCWLFCQIVLRLGKHKNILCNQYFYIWCDLGLADRVLVDTLTTAKIRRRLSIVTQALRQCQKLGPIAEQANIVATCLEAIVDSWLLTGKHSSRSAMDDRRDFAYRLESNALEYCEIFAIRRRVISPWDQLCEIPT